MRLFDNLTEREEEILTLVAHGEANKMIAHNLSISVFTVQNHIQKVFERLEVQSRTQAASKYWQRVSQSQLRRND